jgi:hypothetical protein
VPHQFIEPAPGFVGPTYIAVLGFVRGQVTVAADDGRQDKAQPHGQVAQVHQREQCQPEREAAQPPDHHKPGETANILLGDSALGLHAHSQRPRCFATRPQISPTTIISGRLAPSAAAHMGPKTRPPKNTGPQGISRAIKKSIARVLELLPPKSLFCPGRGSAVQILQAKATLGADKQGLTTGGDGFAIAHFRLHHGFSTLNPFQPGLEFQFNIER